MDDALVVRGLERLGDLPRDVERLRRRERTAVDTDAQRFAVEQLQNQADAAFDNRHLEDADDAGMRQRGNGASFALEAFANLGVAGRLVRQHLDGDRAIEPQIAGAEHFAHAASTQAAADLVLQHPGAGPPRLCRHASPEACHSRQENRGRLAV